MKNILKQLESTNKPVYVELTDEADLTVAVAELTNLVNTASKLFTIGPSQITTTGVAALVERLRLGAEALKALGYNDNSELVVKAINALDDDDQLAEEVKDAIKTEIYGRLKDANNTLFGEAFDDDGNAIFDDDGNVIRKSYDMSVFVKNPNLYALEFSTMVPYWEVISGNPTAWSSWDGNVSHSFKTPYVEDCAIYPGWHTVANVEQTITDLPAGIYTVKFNMWDNSDVHDGTYAYVKTSSTPAPWYDDEIDMDVNYAGYVPIDREANDKEISGIVVTDGILTLGFKSGTQSQPFFEGVRLVMTAPVEGFDYAKAYEELGSDGFMPGDVNNDGEVDVTDVVMIIDWILGKYPNNFNNLAADVNYDGDIDVADVVLVIDAILGKATLHRAATVDGEVGAIALSAFNANSSSFDLSLTNPTAYTAFQMDVTLPMGVSLEKAQLTGRGTDSHHLSISQTGEGRYRIVGVSMGNEALNGNAGNLLNVALQCNGQVSGSVSVDNIVFVTPNGVRHELTGVDSFGAFTGISDVRMSDTKAEAYDLQGRKLNGKTSKNVYIINGKKTVVK